MSTEREGSAALPLEGLKVLDLAWVVAGPVIGRMLADYGATVVRVESLKRVDTTRVMGPFPGGKIDTRQSGLDENCNAGKLGLTLDLASAPGSRWRATSPAGRTCWWSPSRPGRCSAGGWATRRCARPIRGW